MVDAPENRGGGLACLKIVNDLGLGGIVGELQAQIDPRKGGAVWAETISGSLSLDPGAGRKDLRCPAVLCASSLRHHGQATRFLSTCSI